VSGLQPSSAGGLLTQAFGLGWYVAAPLALRGGCGGEALGGLVVGGLQVSPLRVAKTEARRFGRDERFGVGSRRQMCVASVEMTDLG
jgi:hypothetical protein